jgi:NADH dehydrogenase
MAQPRVVIIGGGFGGLYAARGLRRAPVDVTMLDRRNHHLFQPLLYQVATAALNPSDIAAPIRSVLRSQKNATVLLAEARAIDTANKKVLLADGDDVPYDYLIVSTGATHSYFGRDDWARYAPGLKTIEDALEIRRRVLFAYEAAEREQRPEHRKAWMTFVVVGAGPTGVELAGALAEVSRHTLARDFRHINPSEARILLLEGGPRVLPTYPPELSEKAVKQLQRLGVEVVTSAKVTAIDDGGVNVGEQRIDARTKIWAAGVMASPLARSLGAPLDRAGRVKVTPELTVPSHDEIFVIGDLAAVETDGKPVPGVAPAAMQGGSYAARAILRRLAGQKPTPFHYWDKGSLATIGRSSAVADLGRIKLSGFLAWAAWLLIHILYLIGFRNRVLVLVEWFWAYVTFQRGARLITGAERARLEQASGFEAKSAASPSSGDGHEQPARPPI